jgi:hypothetical protein
MNFEHGLSAEDIKRKTGFTLQFKLASFTDPACMAEYHDQHERMSSEYGDTNIVGSFFTEEGEIALGLFFRKDRLIEGQLVRHELDASQPQIDGSKESPRTLTI